MQATHMFSNHMKWLFEDVPSLSIMSSEKIRDLRKLFTRNRASIWDLNVTINYINLINYIPNDTDRKIYRDQLVELLIVTAKTTDDFLEKILLSYFLLAIEDDPCLEISYTVALILSGKDEDGWKAHSKAHIYESAQEKAIEKMLALSDDRLLELPNVPAHGNESRYAIYLIINVIMKISSTECMKKKIIDRIFDLAQVSHPNLTFQGRHLLYLTAVQLRPDALTCTEVCNKLSSQENSLNIEFKRLKQGLAPFPLINNLKQQINFLVDARQTILKFSQPIS